MEIPKIKAGISIDMVFETEIMKSNAHYLKAVIYDFEKDMITISQTTPALNKTFLGRRILVTFLINSDKRSIRFGFPARLIEHISNYEISSGNTVEALMIKKYADPEAVDFRLYFRVKVPSESDLSIFYKEEKVNLMDVSIGGAQFIYPKKYVFRNGEEISCSLIIGTTVFNLKTKVRNVKNPNEEDTNKNFQYISVEFNHDNRKMEDLLSRAIMDIERGLLSKGLI